jgi:PilZ domain
MANEDTSRGSERRRHTRYACDGRAEVVVFRPDLLFRGEVKDISRTGCYIATRARLNLKKFAEIELRFSANGQHLSSLARVMDVRPGQGVGIEFLPGDPRMDQEFHELLERLKAAAQPMSE